jgi:RNA polymerase sigma factor (sigma-70 family)
MSNPRLLTATASDSHLQDRLSLEEVYQRYRGPVQQYLYPDSGSYGNPAQRYAASEERDLIALALAQLPEKQRTILLLRDAEELAYAEIADVLEISMAAVKINLFRARKAFRVAYAAFDTHDGELE